MRTGEVKGNPYHFITKIEFNRLMYQGKFLEYNFYLAKLEDNSEELWYYGITKDSISSLAKPLIVTGIVCALETKKALKGKATIVLIEADGLLRKNRAESRGSFNKLEWDNRFKNETILLEKEGTFENKVDIIVCNNKSLNETLNTILSQLAIKGGVPNNTNKENKENNVKYN